MRRRWMMVMAGMLFFLPTLAQEEPWRNNGSFDIGFAADAWNIELGYNRMLTPFMGAGIGLMIDNEYDSSGLMDYLMESLSDNSSYDSYDEDRIMRLSLIPQLTLRTPTLRLSRKTDPGDGLLLQVQPGIMLSFPVNETEEVPDYRAVPQIPKGETGYHYYTLPTVRVKNENGHWCYWRLRTALGYQLGAGFLYAAYSVSNYSIYDSRRNIRLDGKPIHDYPQHRLTHTVSVGFNIAF